MAGRWEATEQELEKYKDQIPALNQILDEHKKDSKPQQTPVKKSRKPSRVNHILINPFRISVGSNDTSNFVKDLEKLIENYSYDNQYNYGWEVEETVEA